MNFYHFSIFSLLLLAPVYLAGIALLIWIGVDMMSRRKKARIALLPLILLVAVAPLSEEFWIAWKFGKLCSKDAGIAIGRVADAEGFYDPARSTYDGGAQTPQSIEEYEALGFKFYERRLRETAKIAHVEKTQGQWTVTVLDAPKAQYLYQKDAGNPVAYKISRQTSRILDIGTLEVLGRYVRYSRQPPWFFLGLNDPGFECDSPQGGPAATHGFQIYREILRPVSTETGKRQ